MSKKNSKNEWDIRNILKKIEERYSHEGLKTYWEDEKLDVKKTINAAFEEYGSLYQIIDCIAVAGSRIVLKIMKIKQTEEVFVLKIPRPFKDAIELAGKDYEITHDLYYPNLVRIYQLKSLKIVRKDKSIYEIPTTIEEYIPGGKTLRKWIHTKLNSIENEPEMVNFIKNLTLLLSQIIDGLLYLHQNNIYHLDIKPDNILIDSGPTVKIVDFGSSKRRVYNIGYYDEKTDSKIGYTWKYALPKLRKNIIRMSSQNAAINLDEYEYSYARIDYYELGRTIEEIVYHIQQKRLDLQKELFSKSLYNKFQEIKYKEEYLLLIAMRLKGLDAYEDNDEYKGLASNFSKSILNSIKYSTHWGGLDECKNDLLRINLEDIAEYAPEWNENINQTIRMGHLDVPFTSRIRRIYNHPALSRLAKISQLGLVTYVYPSARHSRLEHSMGSYAYGCRYLESLWKQKEDPFFRCITTPDEIMAASLAVLFHDLGQYPLGHDIEDALPSILNHHKQTIPIYEHDWEIDKIKFPSLKSIVEEEWGLDVANLIKKYIQKPTLNDRIDDPKWGIFWDILSGTIDVDKLDYVQRDSINLGIEYGVGIEVDRLINSIVIIKRAEQYKQMPSISLGVTDKGILPARTLITAREHLFERVYWHKTIRSFKAMLSTALKGGVGSMDVLKKLIEQIIYSPNFINLSQGKTNYDFNIPSESYHLVESDFQMLMKLYEIFDDSPSKYLINQILNRKPYPILIDLNKASWSREFDKSKIEKTTQLLQDIFKFARNKPKIIEDLRSTYQNSLLQKNFIKPKEGAQNNPDYANATMVSVLIDFPRRKEELLQSEIIAYDRKNKEELDVNLGIFSLGSQYGFVKSTVPRIFINPLFEVRSKPFNFIHQLEITTLDFENQ